MKKMNSKGFAISTMLYGLLIIIILVIAMILNIMAFNRKNSKEFTSAIVNGLENKLCVRAKTLHTELCKYTDTQYYCSAFGHSKDSSITYGLIGESGTLSTGDAFDCDVNGDGTYDAKTERFYYVTDMNTNTAVLIYYSNVYKGMPSNTRVLKYDANKVEYNGPVTAIKELPTTTQWFNVSLTNTIRAIKNENGGTTTVSGTLPTKFSYEGYAARLLTYQEVNTACYNGTTAITSAGGLSSKCEFFMENTAYSDSSIYTYGTWLETPFANQEGWAWMVSGHESNVDWGINLWVSSVGVRPAIEVLKSNISY